jgi:hypothetical protein
MRVLGGTVLALSDALDGDDVADVKRFARKLVQAYNAIGETE